MGLVETQLAASLEVRHGNRLRNPASRFVLRDMTASMGMERCLYETPNPNPELDIIVLRIIMVSMTFKITQGGN
jgi:hypothetical protein